MFRAPRGREDPFGSGLGAWGGADSESLDGARRSAGLRRPPLRQFLSAAPHWKTLPLWPRIRWRQAERVVLAPDGAYFSRCLVAPDPLRPSLTLLGRASTVGDQPMSGTLESSIVRVLKSIALGGCRVVVLESRCNPPSTSTPDRDGAETGLRVKSFSRRPVGSD